MTLSADDRDSLIAVRYVYQAPKVADLIVAMDKQYGELPAMKKVNETFADLAKKDPNQLKKLNAELEKNPGLAEKIKASLGRDPEAFRTSFLPAVFKNPESALTLAEQQPGPKPQTPAKAPVVQEYGFHEPLATAAAAATNNAAPARTGTVKPADGKNGDSSRFAAKMEQLAAVPGYHELMDRVGKNPELGNAMKAMMAANGTAAEKEGVVDTLLQKTRENPKLFKNLVNILDTTPGAASYFASQVASDPKNALNMMVNFGGEGGPGGMMGMFGEMFAGGGLKDILGGLMGNLNGPGGGFIGAILAGIIGMVSQLFGGGNHLLIGSNVGMTQYEETLKATKANPDSVTVLDANGQTTGATQVAAAPQSLEKTKPVIGSPQQPG